MADIAAGILDRRCGASKHDNNRYESCVVPVASEFLGVDHVDRFEDWRLGFCG
jgi:hypothetical protein